MTGINDENLFSIRYQRQQTIILSRIEIIESVFTVFVFINSLKLNNFINNFCLNFERSDLYCVPLVARGKPITFLNTNNTNFTNIFCWARSQANSRKRLTNHHECGSWDIFERFVASSDAFILHVLNKTDSSHSLDSCSLIHSRKLNYIILC